MCDLDLPYHMLPASAEQSAAGLWPLVDDGLVAEAGEGYRVTALGRWFLRNIALALDAYLARQVTQDRPVFSRAV
jgi:coproporphyrinogen III oxidase-like Fe-S oxidoreductase